MKAALYARYSTELQSEASIVDQFRVAERIAERHGFTVTAKFSDAAISGGTVERPGYRALLKAARNHEFDVIVAEDTSRLWRLLAEQAPRLAELCDLGVHVVTHDLDTRLESAVIMGAVGGAMAETYRKEIGRRTRRGLEGLARAGKSAGGRAFGYISATESGTGQRELHAQHSRIVLEIYEAYASGRSAIDIASDLNRRGVPSPGSSWNRVTRLAKGWKRTAIAGDPSRGTGILNNPIYVGRVIWNRFRWIRSASDSVRRRCVENPKSEWVVTTDERLRIVPDELWDRVKARQAMRSEAYGKPVRKGLVNARVKRSGRKPSFLFSGLLKCGTCGANYVMSSATHYGCSTRVDGGPSACSNDARIKRSVIEPGLLEGIKRDLLAPEVIQEVQRRVQKQANARKKKGPVAPVDTTRLEREVQNLTDAIAGGILRTSPAIADRLRAAEVALARIRATAKPVDPVSIDRIIPVIAKRYRTLVESLEQTLSNGDVDRARSELRGLIGHIRVTATDWEIRLEADETAAQVALVMPTGAAASNVVAGVGFEPTTFGL